MHTSSPIRVILAKRTKKGQLKHITGDFETINKKCEITTEKMQEAGSYYVYVQIDQYTDKNRFKVEVKGIYLESMQEVDHEDCPNFL